MNDNQYLDDHWTDAELDAALTGLNAHIPLGNLRESRSRLMAAIAAPTIVTLPTPATRSTPQPRSGRRRLVLGAAVAAAMVTAAGTAQVVSIGHHRPAGQADAATVLLSAAGKLGSGGLHIPPGEYLRIVQTEPFTTDAVAKSGQSFRYRLTLRTETWVPADEQAPWVRRVSKVSGVTWLQGTAAAAAAAGVTVTYNQGVIREPCGAFTFLDSNTTDPTLMCQHPTWGEATPGFIASLPRDPNQLWQQLNQNSDQFKHGDAFANAADLLRSGLVPADLTAALFTALAQHLPSLVVTNRTITFNGRAATSIGLTSAATTGIRTDLVIDQATGRFAGVVNTFPAGGGVQRTSISTGLVAATTAP